MLIKEKDGIGPQLEALQRLLRAAEISVTQRDQIQDEIKRLKAGAQGEENAAYHINFKLRDSKNYAVLHDLRLEYEGRVAQIDHLIIGRFLDLVLIESKNFTTALRVNERGEFEVRTRFGWKGIESPVEQSQRHALVLEALIKGLDLVPRRLGIPIARKYHHWVLVSPECSLSRPGSEQNLLKMDQFGSRLDQFGNEGGNPLELAKVISSETLMEFARRLAEQHRPLVPDYAARFRIDEVSEPQERAESASKPAAKSRVCAGCGVALDSKVVFFCQINSKRFAGKLFCRACQATATAVLPKCAGCNAEVERKVVEFCQANPERFGHKILCRTCQTQPA